MSNEKASCGDYAEINMQSKVGTGETVGIEGIYHVECRDAAGNLKWSEQVPNLVVAVGKELMLDTLLTGSLYSVVGPYLGLISGSTSTFAATDTMSSHAGWTEFINYTVGGSAVRGTAVFSPATSTGATPANVTSAAASAITYTVTGGGGTIGGCFLVTGPGASATQSNASGTLYSAGAFSTAKITTAGDTVSVSYTTTATS